MGIRLSGELTVLRFKKQRTREEEMRLSGLRIFLDPRQVFDATLTVIGREMETQGPKDSTRLVPSPHHFI